LSFFDFGGSRLFKSIPVPFLLGLNHLVKTGRIPRQMETVMRKILSVIPFLFFISTAEAAYLDLAWDPNEEPDLAGYRVYYGTTSGKYIDFVDVGRVTAYRLDDLLEDVTFYVALTAYDTAGNESDRSDEVSGVGVAALETPSSPTGESDGGVHHIGCFISSVAD
jgi:hypothetical protein